MISEAIKNWRAVDREHRHPALGSEGAKRRHEATVDLLAAHIAARQMGMSLDVIAQDEVEGRA